MIAPTNPLTTWRGDPGWSDWRWQLRHAVVRPEALCGWLGLTGAAAAGVCRVAARYPLRVTPYYLGQARSLSADDPIVRQILPDPRELEDGPQASPDPLAEGRDSPVPGLVHRYPDRALLLTTRRCGVWCRHCMRKREWAVGGGATAGPDLAGALAYLEAHEGIREVLVSGGDPLLLPEARLFGLLTALRRIPHLEVIRIGSRLPVVLPQRLTREFCERLGEAGPVWLATHFNHPQELSEATAAAAERLVRAGVPIVNQTVLLAGINDDLATLAALCTGLLRQRIKPYYLFHGDPVSGTSHFRTGVERGLELLAGLEREVSGLAVPAFAFDLPNGGGKVRLEPAGPAGRTPTGEVVYRDRQGRPCPYA